MNLSSTLPRKNQHELVFEWEPNQSHLMFSLFYFVKTGVYMYMFFMPHSYFHFFFHHSHAGAFTNV